MSTGDLITRNYKSFRGCDFRGEEVNLSRSPDCKNIWRNYKKTSSIETRPSLEKAVSLSETVYGIYFFRGSMLVHCGTRLVQVTQDGLVELYSDLNQRESQGFIYDDVFYLKDGKHYIRYSGKEIGDVEGYIPTTTIARKPAGGGSTYEDVNMLSPYRKNTFLADGESFDYLLDSINIDEDFLPVITVDDEEVTDFQVDYAKGKISFTKAPQRPLTDGRDNVVVLFKKAVEKYSECIEKCTLLQVFDNRVFFSGNEDHPNTVWHCSLDDPSYVSDLDYYREGMDLARVKGMVAGNNALWVFREPSDANTNVFYHTPTLDDDYGKIYPSAHSSITIGCTGKAINFNDDIVFFSQRGMEGISGDVTTEQALGHRSSTVDRLLTMDDYDQMLLAEWEGYLLIFMGKNVYLADSRAMYTNENHMEYDFFYWELEQDVTAVKVENGILYVGMEDGVYTLTGEGNVESWWTIPKDKFQNPNMQKTTNKKGCVMEAGGDFEVYAKTESTEFELVGTFENVTDYGVCRVKKKKWKDIQLKFYSKTRFSLEAVSLEAFVGAYVKR
jgi:hypothetical protein